MTPGSMPDSMFGLYLDWALTQSDKNNSSSTLACVLRHMSRGIDISYISLYSRLGSGMLFRNWIHRAINWLSSVYRPPSLNQVTRMGHRQLTGSRRWDYPLRVPLEAHRYGWHKSRKDGNRASCRWTTRMTVTSWSPLNVLRQSSSLIESHT